MKLSQLFFVVFAMMLLLVAIVYARPEDGSQAITAKSIENDEMKQFVQLQIDDNDDQHDEDSSDSHNDELESSSSAIEHEEEEEEEEPKQEEEEQHVDDKVEDVVVPPVVNAPENVDANNNTVEELNDTQQEHDVAKMEVLMSQLIDDLNRRSKQPMNANPDPLEPRTHKKRAWGGRDLERHRH